IACASGAATRSDNNAATIKRERPRIFLPPRTRPLPKKEIAIAAAKASYDAKYVQSKNPQTDRNRRIRLVGPGMTAFCHALQQQNSRKFLARRRPLALL